MYRYTPEQLAVLLRNKRGRSGLRAIATEIGVSASTLSRIENGRQPDMESFTKICEWLGIEKEPKPSKNVASFSVHFRADRELTPQTANHLGKLLLSVHQSLEAERKLRK